MRDEVVEFEIINSDIYYFRLPELVRAKEVKNNKIHAQNDEIIRKIMVRTVKKTFENLPKKPELFKEHTLLFVHHYNGKSMRDIDNISLKKPVDALNGLLVYDDNMDFNNIFQVSERDEKRYTQLFVIRGRKLKDLAFKMLFEMTGRR